MTIVKNILRTPLFIIIKMAAVYIVGKYCIFAFNDKPFIWSDELTLTGWWTFILYLIYVIAAVIPPDGMDSSPLFIHAEVIKTINKKRFDFGDKIKEARGLYHSIPKFIDDVFYYEHKPISNPLEVIQKAEAFILVLNALNTGSADQLIAKLEHIIEEAEYMLENDCTTLIIKASA
ncbi:hypothetical protein [Paenibacillus montanisoli]|uniref:Uncharacterized protein n=1 Tax=Paenibacillus montanisoli TaxID=2081970 RepID=A0A328U394_9BACL|nr:hypothetical protein [Paenibacillus montanisoli]RAP74376.1 hypothetical protein DL346_20050 [Paenibacillus montanisoli]